MNMAVSTQFRGEYENLKAGFTNGMEKVKGARIGRRVGDAQELSVIARAVKGLSVAVKTLLAKLLKDSGGGIGISRESLPWADFVQRIQEKFEEEWKLADQIVTKSGFDN